LNARVYTARCSVLRCFRVIVHFGIVVYNVIAIDHRRQPGLHSRKGSRGACSGARSSAVSFRTPCVTRLALQAGIEVKIVSGGDNRLVASASNGSFSSTASKL